MAMWSLTTHQAGKCIWPGATRATAIIHVVTSRCHLPVTLGMNWISRGATSHQLDRKCPIISHIFSSIVTLIIDCLRTGWSQLPPQAAEQAENLRQRYGKDKTEGLNAHGHAESNEMYNIDKKTFFITHSTSECWKGFQLVGDEAGGDCAQNWMRQQSSDSERKLILPKR